MPLAAEPRRVGSVGVRIEGSDLPAAHYDDLLEVRVEQSLNVPDTFSLRFIDPYFQLVDSALFEVGSAVDIALAADGPEVEVIRAEVTRLVVEPNDAGRHELVVAGCDRRHRLAGDHRVRVFLNQTNQQIIETVAGAHALRVRGAIGGAVRSYVLQAGTDFALIDECVRREGAVWWLDGRDLHLQTRGQTGAPASLVWAENLRRFRVRASAAEWAGEVSVRSWDPVNQRAVVGRVDLVAESATLPLLTDAPVARRQLQAAARAFPGRRLVSAIPTCDQATADALARWLAQRTSRALVVARGEALGDPTLVPGRGVRVSGIGALLSGTYELTSVEHVLAAGHPYLVRFHCGDSEQGALAELLAHGPGQADAVARQVGLGVVPGVVTNVRDPDQLGRVKVSFPTLGDQVESAWARVAAPGAGKDQGFSLPYDVGDEVVVTFEHGGLDGPLVLGGVWSARNTPPRAPVEDGRINSDTWRSRSGHVVELLDADQGGAGHIALRLRDERSRFELAEDRVELSTPAPASVDSQQRITLRAQQEIVLDAATITLKGKAKIQLQAPVIEVKAAARVAVEGTTAELKGATSAALQGATVRVSGGQVILG